MKNSSSLNSVGPKTNFARTTVDAIGLAVQFDVAAFQQRRDGVRSHPSQHRLDASHQLRGRERLDDVIVGAGGQPALPRSLSSPRAVSMMTGSRSVSGRILRRRQSSNAGNAWQHPVEQKKIGNALLETDVGFIPLGTDFDVVAFGFQIVAEQSALFVFHNHRFLAAWGIYSGSDRHPRAWEDARIVALKPRRQAG